MKINQGIRDADGKSLLGKGYTGLGRMGRRYIRGWVCKWVGGRGRVTCGAGKGRGGSIREVGEYKHTHHCITCRPVTGVIYISKFS